MSQTEMIFEYIESCTKAVNELQDDQENVELTKSLLELSNFLMSKLQSESIEQADKVENLEFIIQNLQQDLQLSNQSLAQFQEFYLNAKDNLQILQEKLDESKLQSTQLFKSQSLNFNANYNELQVTNQELHNQKVEIVQQCRDLQALQRQHVQEINSLIKDNTLTNSQHCILNERIKDQQFFILQLQRDKQQLSDELISSMGIRNKDMSHYNPQEVQYQLNSQYNKLKSKILESRDTSLDWKTTVQKREYTNLGLDQISQFILTRNPSKSNIIEYKQEEPFISNLVLTRNPSITNFNCQKSELVSPNFITKNHSLLHFNFNEYRETIHEQKQEDPYFGFFLLLTQTVKLNNRKLVNVFNTDTSHLFNILKSTRVPFNRWYKEIEQFVLKTR